MCGQEGTGTSRAVYGKVVLSGFLMGFIQGALWSCFRSRFFENFNFGILTSIYAEFYADHENDLLVKDMGLP